MKFCSYCGKEIKNETVICPSCGCQVKEFEEDDVNPGFIILSILIPIVGIIMAMAFWKKTPKAARAYLRAALITIAIEVVIGVLYYILIYAAIFHFINSLFGLISGL